MRNARVIPLMLILSLFTGLVFSQGVRDDLEIAEGLRSDDPREFKESMIALEEKIADRESVVELLLDEEKQKILSTFQPRLHALDTMEPEIWETDEEFVERKRSEQQALENRMASLLRQAEEEISFRQEDWMLEAYHNLMSRARVRYWEGWEIPEGKLYVIPGEYDRNRRIWPMEIGSNWNGAFFGPIDIYITFNPDEGRNIRQEILEMHEAVANNALEPHALWTYSSDFDPLVYDFKVINKVNGISYEVIFPHELQDAPQESVPEQQPLPADDREPEIVEEQEIDQETEEEIEIEVEKEIEAELPAVQQSAPRFQDVSLGFTLGMLIDRETERASVINIIRPVVTSQEYEIGFSFTVLQDTAVELGSSFMSDRSGLLSFIDYFRVGRKDDFFRFYGGFDDSVTLGKGTVVRGLSPLGQAPELRRVPAMLEVPFTKLFIDDIAAPSVMGIRFTASRNGSLLLDAGIGAVLDTGLPQGTGEYSSEVYTRSALIPFIDFSLPIAGPASLVFDAAVMMLIGDGTRLIPDSFYHEDHGIYNFFSSALADISMEHFSMRLGASFGRGNLHPGLYTPRHYRFRNDMVASLFDDENITNHDFNMHIIADGSYTSDNFSTSIYGRIPVTGREGAIAGGEVTLNYGGLSLSAGAEGSPYALGEVSLFGRASLYSSTSSASLVAAGGPGGLSHIALETSLQVASSAIREAGIPAPEKIRFYGGLTQGFHSDFSGGTTYGISSLRLGIGGFGIAARLAYAGDPFADGKIFAPRKEGTSLGIWNLGQGLTGFASFMDITLDILSLVDTLKAETRNFTLCSGHSDPYTLATGVVIRSLDPGTDLPLLRRVPFFMELDAPHFGFQFFIDDIGYPAIAGARTSVRVSREYPLEFGTGIAVDFGSMKTYTYPVGDTVVSPLDLFKRTAVFPFADLLLPVVRHGQFSLDMALDGALLVMVDDNLQLQEKLVETFSSFTGVKLRIGESLFTAGAVLSKGDMRRGMISDSWYRYRDASLAEFLTGSGHDLSFSAYGEYAYSGEILNLSLFGDIPFDDLGAAALGMRSTIDAGQVTASVGFSTPPGSLVLRESLFFAAAEYQTSYGKFSGRISGRADEAVRYVFETSISMDGNKLTTERM